MEQKEADDKKEDYTADENLLKYCLFFEELTSRSSYLETYGYAAIEGKMFTSIKFIKFKIFY